jgi:hypothetical protein
VFNLGLVRLALHQWTAKNPHDRSASAREFAAQIMDTGVRNEIAAALPPELVDALDRLVHGLAEWHG